VSKYDRNHPKATGISDLILDILQNDQLMSSRKVEDTKGIIRSRKIKGQIIQRPKEKRQTAIYKAFHEKLKNEQHEPR